MASTNLLPAVKALLTEGLKAGGYLRGKGEWQVYHSGERLPIRDLKVDKECEGAVVVAGRLDVTLLMASALSDLRNLVIIGNRLAPEVDLSKVRAERLRRSAAWKASESYWAVYIIEERVVVSLGLPFSSSRFVGEILRAQIGRAFEHRRVCAGCGALNAYRAQRCTRCRARLVETGRLNRWVHYDDKETILHKLTPEEEEILASATRGKPATGERPWEAETLRHRLSEQEQALRDALTAPTLVSRAASRRKKKPPSGEDSDPARTD